MCVSDFTNDRLFYLSRGKLAGAIKDSKLPDYLSSGYFNIVINLFKFYDSRTTG